MRAKLYVNDHLFQELNLSDLRPEIYVALQGNLSADSLTTSDAILDVSAPVDIRKMVFTLYERNFDDVQEIGKYIFARLE